MKTYKCLAVDKENKTNLFIEGEYKTKKAFVSDLYYKKNPFMMNG